MGCKSFATREWIGFCVCNMCLPWPQLTKLNATESIYYIILKSSLKCLILCKQSLNNSNKKKILEVVLSIAQSLLLFGNNFNFLAKVFDELSFVNKRRVVYYSSSCRSRNNNNSNETSLTRVKFSLA